MPKRLALKLNTSSGLLAGVIPALTVQDRLGLQERMLHRERVADLNLARALLCRWRLLDDQ
jgi:hypothetical protein